jgi:hypothetical protein
MVYNLTVAEAHTYFVGAGRWLVHNACLPSWAKNGGSLVNHAKNLERAYKKSKSIPSAEHLDEIVEMARQHNVYIRLDGPHKPPWDVPHLNIGGSRGRYHIPVPSGYTLP